MEALLDAITEVVILVPLRENQSHCQQYSACRFQSRIAVRLRKCKTAWNICQFWQKRASNFSSNNLYLIIFKCKMTFLTEKTVLNSGKNWGVGCARKKCHNSAK
ncbi:hypothetical protein [Methylomicrobium sp. Wu6]|uniref:hypothetical protein n=1 Tax=Methylomicrobium sp. Wu6 TaxID=3107928 RepID=UPI002DD64169|nr:hypothetical protein [Methylomicrobium sp. Wu6]MEC4748624.1 hypothetical protein [Methylomicrobium sp. Wu6]